MQPRSNAIVKTNRDPTITCIMGVINHFLILNKNFLNGYTYNGIKRNFVPKHKQNMKKPMKLTSLARP